MISTKRRNGEIGAMKFLIDTNIILDWLQKRQPFFSDARAVMMRCLFDPTTLGFVSAHSLCDIFYILRKEFSSETRFQLIHFLSVHFSVIAEGQEDFLIASTTQGTTDLEDTLQVICAQKMQVDYIVTRNIDDFRHSPVPAILPQNLPK